MTTIEYPGPPVPVNHIAPSPRRVRATIGDEVVLDTIHAVYLWEVPYFPAYYVPLADITKDVLVDENHEEKRKQGTARRFGLHTSAGDRPAAASVFTGDTLPGLQDMVRLRWDALDHWFEEDEEIFGHPRNPYSRVDALRSTRHIRVEKDGILLAESSAPVILYETGLPPRYYLDRTALNIGALERTDTVTLCPYKGRTSDYWAVRTPAGRYPDLAWSYAYPAAAVAAIAGLVAFYNEQVDITVDGERLDRPVTPFSH
ncbi:DUF427 domain-containing protein [Actinoplanes sp. RD1]|uniref:DUF427 domain-containing protein n=1 Tax=Actinoplanes sp. RD1 TaxID=3064538 RepID=UPI0027404C3E|nr:DUF427 domain-containing protein [Actinoplanes sp. RD1]